MVERELLDIGSEFHLECLWFCFQLVLQDDLDEVKNHWNTHRIRRSKHGTVPGVPDILFFLPQRSGAIDCKVDVTNEQITEIQNNAQVQLIEEEDQNILQDYFHYVMDNEDLQYPSNHAEACDLFEYLITAGNPL